MLDSTSQCGASEYAGDVACPNFAEIELRLNALEVGTVPLARTIATTLPLTGGGTLAANLTLGIQQATGTTDGFLSKGNWVTFNAKMTNPMTADGDLIYGGTAGAPSVLVIGAAGTVLHSDGTVPSWSAVVESDITLAANTTNNVTTARHGFAPILPNNAAQYLNGQGNWTTPSGQTNAYTTHAFAGSVLEVVIHNFNAYPLVQVIDGAGLVIAPATITHDSVNQVTLTFGAPSTGTILLTLGSPQAQAYRTVPGDYTIDPLVDRIVKATGAASTITLPTAVGYAGREFVIDNASGGNITLDGNGAETIEGETTQTLPNDSAIHVYSDGANWRIY